MSVLEEKIARTIDATPSSPTPHGRASISRPSTLNSLSLDNIKPPSNESGISVCQLRHTMGVKAVENNDIEYLPYSPVPSLCSVFDSP